MRPECSTATSRSAANGGTRDARIAGKIEATAVTTMPTMKPVSKALGDTTRLADSRTAPRFWNNFTSRAATTIPRPVPITAARTPISRLSPAMAPSTCPREAPTARNSADSRLFCAVITENVL